MNNDLLILFATTTGNAEQCANSCATHLRANGFSPTVANMSDFPPHDIAKASTVIAFVSTWGDGDPPDDAVPFFEALQEAEDLLLDGTRYAIFALGDRGYEHFCGFGRNLDEALAKRGAARIHATIECDVDFDCELSAWNAMLTDQLALIGK